MTDLVTVPAWALVLPWCLVPVAFVAGQIHRGWMHARGIRQNHFNHIVGGKFALWGLGLAGLVVIGATR